MCEYCGCQQIATIAELTREHDAVVALVGQIKTSLLTDVVTMSPKAANRSSRSSLYTRWSRKRACFLR